MAWLWSYRHRPVRAWVFLTLIANAIIFTCFLMFGSYFANTQSKFRSDEIEQDIKRVSQSIAASVTNDLLAENLENIEALAKQHLVLGSLSRLSIINAKNNVLMTIEHYATSKEKPGIGYIEVHYGSDDHENQNLLTDSFTYRAPIYAGGEVLGWVEATGSLSGLQVLKRQIWMNTLIISLVAAAFTCFIFILSLRNFSRSLNRVIYFAKDLEHNLDAEIDVPSGIQELIILQDALNTTAATLAQKFQEIEDAEARKTALLEASLDSLVTVNSAGTIIDFNSAAELTFGFAKDEVLGKKLTSLLIPEKMREFYERNMENYINYGRSDVLYHHIETTSLRSDGSEFPVELSVVPFISNGEHFFLSSFRDISARKRLEEKQKQTNLLLNQTVHELKLRQTALDEHAIVSIADPLGNIVYSNEKFTDISGYSLEELLGQNHSILRPGVQDIDFYNQMWKLLTKGRVWHGELCNRRKDGTLYWVMSTIVPMINDDNGSLSQLISIHTDITTNKENELRLAEYRDYQQTLIEQYQKADRELAIARRNEMAVGHQIQQSLLFSKIPSFIDCYDISVHSEPSKGVDGDFYEYFNFDDAGFDIAIADVMGKGVTASLIGAAVKLRLNRVVTSLMIRHNDQLGIPAPEMIINKLHDRVVDKLISLESFITLFYMRVNPRTHQISYINAGHTRGLLISNHQVILLEGENLPLGVLPEERYVTTNQTLQENDLIFLYSDGLTEAKNNEGEEFGEQRLAEALLRFNQTGIPIQTMIQAVRKTIDDYSSHRPLSDDRTCIAVNYNTICPRNDNVTSLQVDWDLAGLTPLRTAVTNMGEKFNFQDETLNAINLAVFETATNIVRHNPKPLKDATLDCRIRFIDGALHQGERMSV